MAKATEKSNSISTMTQTPGSAVITALVGRLRIHARGIHNAAAKRTIGRDMVAAADALEHMLCGTSQAEASAAAMAALLGRDGFAAYVGEDRRHG